MLHCQYVVVDEYLFSVTFLLIFVVEVYLKINFHLIVLMIDL